MASVFRSVSSIKESDSPIINNEYPDYLYYGQFERTDDIDKRIYERTLATDIKLRPNFDPRPVDTRHILYPIVPSISRQSEEVSKTTTKTSQIPIREYLEYDITKVFSPIQSKAPIEGYLHNVNTESSLRNQFFGIQHGAIQSVYIPSSNSDLYRPTVPFHHNEVVQPFPLLFEKDTYTTTGNNQIYNSSIGKNIFNNATKQQMRNM